MLALCLLSSGRKPQFLVLFSCFTNPATVLSLGASLLLLNAVVPRVQAQRFGLVRSAASTFLVTSDDDSGTGTLRQAILDANVSPGTDTIAFAIGSGPCTIRPERDLPEITDSVAIDGRTQPGYQGRPIVELDGSDEDVFGAAIFVSASGSTVAGLVINRFDTGIYLDETTGVRIVNNYIGTNLDGTAVSSNSMGIVLHQCVNTTIGGVDPADRNVLSGNRRFGLRIEFGPDDMAGNVVRGNFIGTDAEGTADLGNGMSGIEIHDSAGNIIGGREPGAGNVISGNGGSLEYGGGGIQIYGSADINDVESTTTIEGNRIGTDVSGVLPLGNDGSGIAVLVSGPLVVGGIEPGAGNILAFNGGAGVYTNSGGVKVFGNSMFGNRSGGIAHHPSLEVPRPTITSVATSGNEIRIRGAIDFRSVVPGPPIIVQFYANDTCDGNDEAEANGQRFLGAIEATGNERGVFVFETAFPGSLPPQGGVTATATSARYRTTSTLSPCVNDTGGCVRPFIVERPVAVDVTAGASAAFSVGVDSSGPISYQWYEVRSERTFLIEGATASTFETPPLSSVASYRVVVTNACGTTSADTSATVCSNPPVITAEPDSLFPGANEVVGISVELAEPANYTYQWYRGRTGDTSDPIPGGVSRVFFVGVAAKTSFWVRVANACGSVDSDTATLTPGPFIDKVKYSVDSAGEAQLVLKGSGLSDLVYVTINGFSFLEPAVVRKNRVAVQKGKLSNGRTLRQSLPLNSLVMITVRNEMGTSVAVVLFTRR